MAVAPPRVADSSPLVDQGGAAVPRVGRPTRTLMLRLALRSVVARWGRVVNVASIAGKAGAPYIAAYASTKHAVIGFTRAVAAELAPRGVTVNAVCPGYVDTDMTTESVARIVGKTGIDPAQALDVIRKSSPQNRLFTAE